MASNHLGHLVKETVVGDHAGTQALFVHQRDQSDRLALDQIADDFIVEVRNGLPLKEMKTGFRTLLRKKWTEFRFVTILSW